MSFKNCTAFVSQYLSFVWCMHVHLLCLIPYDKLYLGIIPESQIAIHISIFEGNDIDPKSKSKPLRQRSIHCMVKQYLFKCPNYDKNWS